MSECRVHSCVFQQRVVAQKSEPNPQRSCNCRRVVSQTEADELVRWGEATRLVLARERKELEKPCEVCEGGDLKTSCDACKKTGKKTEVKINDVHGRDIVLVAHRTKTNRVSTPRVPTIEAKHIYRANVSRETVERVESALRSLGEDSFEAEIEDILIPVRVGYISEKERRHAQERIDEYGLMILRARAFPGPTKCTHRPEFKCSRCGLPEGQRVYVIGKEPVGGRESDWGRAI